MHINVHHVMQMHEGCGAERGYPAPKFLQDPADVIKHRSEHPFIFPSPAESCITKMVMYYALSVIWMCYMYLT